MAMGDRVSKIFTGGNVHWGDGQAHGNQGRGNAVDAVITCYGVMCIYKTEPSSVLGAAGYAMGRITAEGA